MCQAQLPALQTTCSPAILLVDDASSTQEVGATLNVVLELRALPERGWWVCSESLYDACYNAVA